MIQKPDVSDRRILTFPAVHPSEAISPTTLLTALISLSRQICNQSKTFTTQKKNSRESIRIIRNLLIFFEEIHDLVSDFLPDSIILCFSELHFTFQKLRFLLEDCTREGTRLWILMKSERISTEFRVLIRTVATALDILPLLEIELPMEVRELVELVKKQVHKEKFDVEPDDKRAVKDVLSMLKQFESGIAPDPVDLRRVLDHLGIRSWSECDKEVRFLDEELGLESLNGDQKREVVHLSSLMAFMSYCRGVLFNFVDNRVTNKSELDGRGNVEVVRWLNSEDFRCPISLELMIDPVTITTGQTYDRSSITKWFKGGNLTCPKTGEKLRNTELVPNSILRKFIRQFCSDTGIPITESTSQRHDITRTISAGSPASAEAMKLLSGFLKGKLMAGMDEEKNRAAYEIRVLSKSSIFNRSCIVEAGTIPFLLNLLSSQDPSTQENAIAALLNLSKHPKSKTAIIDNDGLRLILYVLRKGNKMEARQFAAATMFYLSSIEDYQRLIGENPDAIPALVELIKEGTLRGKKNAMVAIFGLLMFPDNHRRVLSAGAVPLLIDLLNSSKRPDLVTDALAVLANLAEKPEGTNAILCTSWLSLLTGIFHSSTSRTTKEYCVSVLLSLSINGGQEVIFILQKTPSLIKSLYSLLTEGNSRASRKASSLITILHQFHNTSSSHLITPAVPQEQFIHVW